MTRRGPKPIVDDFEPAPGDTMKAGRGVPFTDVGEWVVMAKRRDGRPISDRACRIYWILRAHVKRDRTHDDGSADERAWPTQEDMAEMIGIVRYEPVGRAVQELVEVGAVDVEQQRHPQDPMRKRNVYTVHREAPDSYAGPLSTNEWHIRAKAERAAAEVATAGDESAGGTDTPDSGCPSETEYSQVGRTPRIRGVGSPRIRGVGSPRIRGSNQNNSNQTLATLR